MKKARDGAAAADGRGLRPAGPLSGSLPLPPSKSQAQRALLVAGIARGLTHIGGLGPRTGLCADVEAAVTFVEGSGARVEFTAPPASSPAAEARVRVEGTRGGPLEGASRAARLEAGESGTLARLATALLVRGDAARDACVLDVSGSLRTRTSGPLFAALRAAGAGLAEQGPPGGWPVAIAPLGDAPAMLSLEQPVSSQEVSALLLLLATRAEAGELIVRGAIPSRPYLALTRDVLVRFGAEVEETRESDGARFRVRGPLIAPAQPLLLEPDASAAAVALAAACISDGELLVPGLAPAALQGDVRIAEHLTRFGCRARFQAGGLYAAGRPTRGARLDLTGEPDLAPVLAALGAALALRCPEGAAHAVTHLSGLATLQRKESRRIDVLAAGLARLGLRVEARDDALTIAPGRPHSDPVSLDTQGDHRMAFAFALLGLARDGVGVSEPACVAKSWPGFWTAMQALGARTEP